MTTPEESLARIEKLRVAMAGSYGHQLFATYIADLLEHAVTGPDGDFEEELKFIFPSWKPDDVSP